MNGTSSMTKVTSIALAQLNSHLGNIGSNVARLLDARRDAAAVGADIVVTPEMYLSGYPCDDLVLRSDFMDEVAAGLAHLATATSDSGPAIIVGAPHAEGGVVTNSVFVLDEGRIGTPQNHHMARMFSIQEAHRTKQEAEVKTEESASRYVYRA